VGVERVESGIPGLDELIEGGFIKNSMNLITGQTGTCKTIFCCQFLWQGLQNGENVVYITLEESPEDIKSQALQLGMDFEKYINEGKCIIEYIYPKSFSDLDYEIFTKIKQVNANRFVLDSITLLGFYMEGAEEKLRDKVFTLMQRLKKHNITALIVSEIPEGSNTISRFGFEEFVVDGVIGLHYLEYAAGGTPRSLVIRKMRRTNHSTNVFSMDVTKDGIKISPLKRGIIV